MFKQSAGRNQRSKGFKKKHALQIALLLAVCVWLIYQVKHSHDKKKAFEETAAKLSEKIEIQHDIIKFGRKDLNPRVERTASENERHGEKEETQEEEEEEKHEEEEQEQEQEENKPEESENEGRGDGDDEIDEHEQQRTEEEAKREDDFVDEEEREKHDNENEENEMEDTQSNEIEEKETEEETKESELKQSEEETKESEEKETEEKETEEESKESADKENEEESKENEKETKEIEEKENEEETKEKEDQIEEQDHDKNTQEAREEQYKGDDASSAVVRDTQAVSTETENGVIENSNEKEHAENLQVNESGIENKTSNLDEVTSEQMDSDLKVREGETLEGNSTVNATDGNSTPTVNATAEIQEKGTEINLSKLGNESLPILTTEKSIYLQEVNNSSTSENVGTRSGSLQNGTDITEDQTVETTSSNGEDLDQKPVLLDQTENSNMTVEILRSDSNSSLSTTTQNEGASKKEPEESFSNSETIILEEQNAKEEASSESSTTNENGDVDQNEKSETTTEEEDNSLSSTTNDTEDLIDSNSTEDSLFPEVKEAQTDLETLPEIETEGNNSEDVAAER